ncbi:MAG: hypothetical protein CfP315_0063 [Candidatus Improbicoccus pseudotrichonymphae]|uniref:Uncharacterized protein n=1 Tax=Candidatus Improbicoccus pseudotrichonymphae TaxID=3033792 RepID=A0AA48IGM0_9FIRM|nr:MAG: hypothetical protein CfP315_0063 [Candidatus Improbicoccus pseudotrichonymphae]
MKNKHMQNEFKKSNEFTKEKSFNQETDEKVGENVKKPKTIYFDTYNEQKIGNTTYIIESHFLKEGDTVIDKIKNLIKADLRSSNSINNDV